MEQTIDADVVAAAQELLRAGATGVYLFSPSVAGAPNPGTDIELAVEGLPDEVFFKAAAAAQDCLQRELLLISLDHETPFTQYLRQEGELTRVA